MRVLSPCREVRYAAVLVCVSIFSVASAFQRSPMSLISTPSSSRDNNNNIQDHSRRSVLCSAGMFGGFFGSEGSNNSNRASAASGPGTYKSKGPTNEVVKVVNGMKRRRLGGSDILVSELGLGTQRWVSADFNAPDKNQCFSFMDKAILEGGGKFQSSSWAGTDCGCVSYLTSDYVPANSQFN